MDSMLSFCENLKIIFDKKARSVCSVSIKVPLKGRMTPDTIVKNLCRDAAASKKRDTDAYNKLAHSILGNAAYQKILNRILRNNKEKKLFYLNNNILSNPDYENTSKDAYEDGVLPYKSELVYPIVPIKRDANDNTLDCIGFICIDSSCVNSFDEKYDVAIVSGVADSIYDILTYRSSLLTKSVDDGKAG